MKHFSIMLAAVAMFFAASCQKETFVSGGEEAVITFSTQFPGLSTKAVADGETVNTLYYEVYTVDAQGNSEKLVYDGTSEVVGKNASINVRLIKNKAYNVYFWAQYEATDFTSPYTVDNLQNIAVSYNGALANDERRDAFYTVLKSVAYSGSKAETVTLKRAFAQVNLATEDLALVLSHGSRPTTSSIEITNLATSFNTFTGEGTGSEDAVFATAYISGLNDANVADYTVDTVEDLKNVGLDLKSYDYLATAYVLVPAAEGLTSLSTIKAVINFEADNSIELNHQEATIQKNWRTNIYGNLLSGQVTHNITVDQRFDDEDYNYESVTGSEQIVLTANLDNVVYLQPGEYTLPDYITILRSSQVSGSIKFIGAADGVVIIVDKDKNYLGLPISFSNVTLKFAEKVGFLASVSETYENCKIEGAPVIYGETSSFDGCDLQDAEEIIVKGETTITDCTSSNIKTEGDASLSFYTNDINEVSALVANGGTVGLSGDITTKPLEHNGYGNTVLYQKGGVLDGCGKTLKVTNANGGYDSAITTNGGTIKNITIDGSFRGIFMGQIIGEYCDLYIDNVVMKNVVYTFNSDGETSDASKNYSVYVTNSVINGWTSFSNKHKLVTFENCSFSEGSGYAFCRPYNDTVFKNCDFNDGQVEAYMLDTSVSGISITFENCRYNGEPLTANSAMLYKYADTQNVIFK